jgi:lipid II:glycine glycyltransferase (peptidoglycan interpeptide bridge formation enzyme)
MEVVTLPEQQWEAYLSRLPAYSYLATPAWSRILADALGYKSQALCYRFPDAEFLLPLAVRRNRLGELDCRSMPFGTYGGPLLVGGDAASDPPGYASAIARDLRHRIGFGYLVACPGPYPHLALPRVYERTITHMVDLSQGSEAVWKRMDKDARNQVRQAERAGVNIRIDNSIAAFLAYYEMLEASARRWGLNHADHPWSLFEAVCQQADSGRVALWLATVNDSLAAGVLLVYGKGEAFYFSGAMYKELAHSRPNNLLQWRVLQDAAARGYWLYNMGAGAHLTGVRKFKEAFGAEPVEYPSYIVAGPVNGLIRKVRRWR